MIYKNIKDLPGAKKWTLFKVAKVSHWYHLWLVWNMVDWSEYKNFVSESYIKDYPEFFEIFYTICESEAFSAFNTLVWYCVWKWMKVREYKDSDDLLYSMRWPIRELHSIIKNIK